MGLEDNNDFNKNTTITIQRMKVNRVLVQYCIVICLKKETEFSVGENAFSRICDTGDDENITWLAQAEFEDFC